MTSTIRNILIVLVLAALLVLIPGGGDGAAITTQALSLAFLGVLVYFASVMYRQHRLELYSLGDRNRAVLYAAVGVVVLTVTASARLWSSGAGVVVWFVLVGAAVYAVLAVVLAARRY